MAASQAAQNIDQHIKTTAVMWALENNGQEVTPESIDMAAERIASICEKNQPSEEETAFMRELELQFQIALSAYHKMNKKEFAEWLECMESVRDAVASYRIHKQLGDECDCDICNPRGDDDGWVN